MFFYSDTAGASGASPVPYHKQNAVKSYLRHYDNLMFLKFVASESSDANERRQANKEIAMCEKKLTHWMRHANYDRDEALRGVDAIKRQWASKRVA